MNGFTKAAAYLPAAIKNTVNKLPESLKARVQEIRLRIQAPLTLSTPDGEMMVTKAGEVTRTIRGNLLSCNQNMIEECFLKLCEYSVHTHQHELCNGFVTAPNGCRAGVAGTAVIDNGKVVSIRDITSICLRVARRHDGCASSFVSALIDEHRLRSTLICGEPSSGKSSLLKDLARQLSMGLKGQYYRTAVVDERGELSCDGSLISCDVLKHCPKAEGIQQAVRCLAPDVVIFDEMGTAAETAAVIEGLNSGVAAVATAHCHNRETLLRRPQLASALSSGAFEQVIFLKGRRCPGSIACVMETRDLFAKDNRNIVNCTGGDRRGTICIDSIEPARC